MKITARRGQFHEREDGSVSVQLTIMGADVGAMVNMAKTGGEIFLCDAAELGRVPDAAAPKPPTIEVKPEGKSQGFVGNSGTMPAKAKRVMELVNDPLFQEYAVVASRVPPGDIPDAVAHALAYVLTQCRAREPEDFADTGVIARFAGLETQYATYLTKRGG